MLYDFICDKCGNESTKNIPMSEISTTEVTCNCGARMRQKWSSALYVPEYMRAGEEQEMEWVKDRLKNSPSGKRKILY